jgi:hypothetical protein
MPRRLLLLLGLALASMAGGSPAALAAYAPLWSQPVAGAAQLVAGDAGATVVWAVGDGPAAALLARRYEPSGEPLEAEPTVLVSGIVGLSDWLATSDDGSGVVVVWKAGGVTAVRRVAVNGAGVYGPVIVCSDVAVAALRGSGATAAPVQLAPDGLGGVYVRLLATPSLDSGDTLLAYVSPLGASALPDPGLPVGKGTVADMGTDALGHLAVLLSGPGRRSVAAQWFAPDLTAEWPEPITPYNPLVGPPPAAPQTPLGVVAASGATIAWHEGSNVKMQRFSAAGQRLWLHPVRLAASDATTLADDSWGGCFVAGASGDGLRVQHIAGDGSAVGEPSGSVLHLGLDDPNVIDVSSDRAGDLAVAYGDGQSSAGVARMTYLGAWSKATLSPPPAALGALDADGAGGAYALGAGTGASLWRFGEAGAGLTFCPHASAVTFGDKVAVAGFLTVAGVPITDSDVEIRWTSARGVTRTAATATTDDDGFYRATIAPEATADWTAVAAVPGGVIVVSDVFRGLTVAPEVSIALATGKAGGGYVEVFSGAVKPAHPGSRVLVQRRSGGSWHTVARGPLDGRSRYRVSWPLPRRSATYVFRTLLPAHADHAAGVSRNARLRVVVSAGG